MKLITNNRQHTSDSRWRLLLLAVLQSTTATCGRRRGRGAGAWRRAGQRRSRLRQGHSLEGQRPTTSHRAPGDDPAALVSGPVAARLRPPLAMQPRPSLPSLVGLPICPSKFSSTASVALSLRWFSLHSRFVSDSLSLPSLAHRACSCPSLLFSAARYDNAYPWLSQRVD